MNRRDVLKNLAGVSAGSVVISSTACTSDAETNGTPDIDFRNSSFSPEKRAKALEKDTSAKDKIAAALARAKAKKQASTDESNDSVSKSNTTTSSDSTPATKPANAAKDKVAEAIALSMLADKS